MGLSELWDTLVCCVCRPPRDNAYTEADLHGGLTKRFNLRPGNGSVYPCIREDLELVNKRGHRLQCSHFKLLNVQGRDGRLPCVIYCHCNSGSRRDSFEAIEALVPMGISVFALDFAGSGLSDGEWVTLGAHEVDDVETAVNYLRSTGSISTLGLWGRSMGAVTALLYSHKDPSIAAMVLDSPFSSLIDLMQEITQEQDFKLPKPLMKIALAWMKRCVRKRAGFDITTVCPINVVHQSFIPAKFCHAEADSFVRIHHTERLFEAYAGDKEFNRVEGDHNSPRPAFLSASAGIFFCNRLQLTHWLVGGKCQLLDEMSANALAAINGNGSSSNSSNSNQHGARGGVTTGSGARSLHQRAANGTAGTAHTTTTIALTTSPPMSPNNNGPWQRDTLRTASNAIADAASRDGLQDLGLEDVGDDEDDAMLAHALHASLQEYQQQQTRGRNRVATLVVERSDTGATCTGSDPGSIVSQDHMTTASAGHSSRLAPVTQHDEEEMLRQAIALSLQGSTSQAATPGASTATNPATEPKPDKDSNAPTDYVDMLCAELGSELHQPS